MAQAAVEEATYTEERVEKRRSGPGFLLGMTLGTIAGAAAATLFSPMSGEEIRHRAAEEAESLLPQGGPPDVGAEPSGPADRLRTALARIRGRLQEARTEGRQAAEEAEASLRSRFDELSQ